MKKIFFCSIVTLFVLIGGAFSLSASAQTTDCTLNSYALSCYSTLISASNGDTLRVSATNNGGHDVVVTLRKDGSTLLTYAALSSGNSLNDYVTVSDYGSGDYSVKIDCHPYQSTSGCSADASLTVQ